MAFDELNTAWRLLVALAIGLLIGLERERRKGHGATRAPTGFRTFALVAALGGLAQASGSTSLLAVSAVLVGAAALLGYVLSDRSDPGLTTEVALVVVFVLGALAQTQPALALGCAVIVACLLMARVPMHRFACDVLTADEFRNGLIFVVAPLARCR